MKEYFAINLDNRTIQSESGDTFTVEQFKTIIERAAEQNKFFDMTMMTARFIRYNYDWNKLETHYGE